MTVASDPLVDLNTLHEHPPISINEGRLTLDPAHEPVFASNFDVAAQRVLHEGSTENAGPKASLESTGYPEDSNIQPFQQNQGETLLPGVVGSFSLGEFDETQSEVGGAPTVMYYTESVRSCRRRTSGYQDPRYLSIWEFD